MDSSLTLQYINSQYGQAHFKNLAANATKFLKLVWPFWDIKHCGVNIYILDCTRTLTTIHGVLESPNYPGLYPASTFCNWRLVGPTDSSVEVQFEDFHLEEAVNFFCDDYVNVYEGSFVRVS